VAQAIYFLCTDASSYVNGAESTSMAGSMSDAPRLHGGRMRRPAGAPGTAAAARARSRPRASGSRFPGDPMAAR